MPWPLPQDYNEAIQSPAVCFADGELRRGQPVLNRLGLPLPRSGNFADVYEFTCPTRKWALKCFTREVPGLRERYAAISAYLRRVPLPFMVDFTYLDRGIRIHGQWYPIVKMHWVEGFTLNEFVRKYVEHPSTLDTLAQLWVRLARRLREARIAHCDLQHGNVLLVPGTGNSLDVKLVDYDGMWVPALARWPSNEVGHPAYQHPQRLREGTYGLEVDRFPHLVIYCALRCLMAGGRCLWERYDNGDNLLFRQQDLETPERSTLFQELLGLPDQAVRGWVIALMQAAKRPLDQTPILGDVHSQGMAPSQAGPEARVAPPPSVEPISASATGEASQVEKSSAGKRRFLAIPIVAGLFALAVLAGVGFFTLPPSPPSTPEKKQVAQKDTHETSGQKPMQRVQNEEEESPPVEDQDTKKPKHKVIDLDTKKEPGDTETKKEPKTEPVKKPQPKILQDKTWTWQGAKESYANYNALAIAFEVGMGTNQGGFGCADAGIEIENVGSIKLSVDASPSFQHLDANSFAGFFVDYHVAQDYVKQVAFGAGMRDDKRWAKRASRN